MVCCNDIPSVINYGTSAVYKDLPSPEQVASGVVPLDSLPAAWWNAMWACNNVALNCARTYMGQIINELNTVLTQAGVIANCTCVDQLYQAITKLRRIVGDSTYPGAVKSSSCPGEVSIDQYGVMTANCVGNAALLNTTAKNVVGAINELKSTYDTCWTNNTTALGGKAPTSHASTATTYGVGNASNYGHVKVSDTYDCCIGAAADSIAASQKALYCVYSLASTTAAVGNTAGCALGIAAAGTCTTAARSDHVHPLPALVCCSKCNCIINYTGDYDRPVLLTCGACAYEQIGRSTVCSLTFNPSTGTLCAGTFCGIHCGYSYGVHSGNQLGTSCGLHCGRVYSSTDCSLQPGTEGFQCRTAFFCTGNAACSSSSCQSTIIRARACCKAGGGCTELEVGTQGVYFKSHISGSSATCSCIIGNKFYGNVCGCATCATCACHPYIYCAGAWSNWYWAGQSGQPAWLWGGNDGANMYVYNPSCFSVACATCAKILYFGWSPPDFARSYIAICNLGSNCLRGEIYINGVACAYTPIYLPIW